MSDKTFDQQDLIAYRLERARETLRDAELLFEQGGTPASVVNRAYYGCRRRNHYAMFYVVLALLITVGAGTSKHSGVIALFDEHFVRPGKFPKEMSKVLHRAFELRQIGDYRELLTLDKA
jgi:uncharacterized protein (UPF0332 family)